MGGWTLLPGSQGAQLHRLDPERAGYLRCGRQADPHAPVHTSAPDFDRCTQCAELVDPVAPNSGESSSTVPRQPTPDVGERLHLGWVKLPGRLLHRAHPTSRHRVACGKNLPPEVRVYPRRPDTGPSGDWQNCPVCEKVLPDQIARAQHRGRLDTGRRTAMAPRPSSPEPLSGPRLVAAWRTVGWVVLADKRRAHRPHPQHPRQVLCGRPLDARLPIEKTPPQTAPCRRCTDVLHRRQENLGIRTRVISNPDDVDRYSRTRDRGTSVRAIRGGLPTLGRDR